MGCKWALAIIKKKKKQLAATYGKNNDNELVNFLKYKLWIDLVTICELNFKLVNVEKKLSQHYIPIAKKMLPFSLGVNSIYSYKKICYFHLVCLLLWALESAQGTWLKCISIYLIQYHRQILKDNQNMGTLWWRGLCPAPVLRKGSGYRAQSLRRSKTVSGTQPYCICIHVCTQMN